MVARNPRSRRRSKRRPPPTTPSKCTELQTLKFNEQEKGSGPKATELCEKEAAEHEEPAESVNVSNVEVEGGTATAEAAIEGSALNGQTVELELVEEGGKWKLNQFLGFASYDGEALAEGVEKGLEKQGGLPASEVKCFADGVRGMSEEEAEEVAFEGNVEVLEALGCE